MTRIGPTVFAGLQYVTAMEANPKDGPAGAKALAPPVKAKEG